MAKFGRKLTALFATAWLALLPSPVSAGEAAARAAMDVAVIQAPADSTLDDLLKGRVLPGFTPVLSEGVSLEADSRKRVWLRLKVRAPRDAGGQWQVRLKRQGIQAIRAYSADAPSLALDVLDARPGERRRWFPDSYYLPLPALPAGGETTLYLQIGSSGYVNFAPQLQTPRESARADLVGELQFAATYLAMALAIALAFARQRKQGVRMVGMEAWALVLLFACISLNGHVGILPGGGLLSSVGTGLAHGLFVIGAGQALWATRIYAGMDRHLPRLSSLYDKAAWGLLLLGVAAIYVPRDHAALLQLGLLALWTATGLACMFGLAMDSRQTRWSAIFGWCGLLLSLLAIVLAYKQLLPATLWVGLGFQMVLALLVLLHVILPWLRSLMQARQQALRKQEPVVTPEERIARARTQLMNGLNSALKAASEGDLEWIAFRRLLEGLKPVLPQAASAVVAMNYHNEDLLLVEPKEAKERYAMLLEQRGSMLRNLSRSTAPQQISIDFDGPDGPLEHVQLAIIPLPIEKPGWGALLVERNVEQEYSERELDMCAEFASLATTAGEEAAHAMEQRRAAEIDPDVGVYRRAALDPILAKAYEAATLQLKPLSILLVALDAHPRLAESQRLPAMHALAGLLRGEADYGQVLGRMEEDELLLVAPGMNIGQAREFGDRLCAAARKFRVESLPGVGFQVSIGIAQIQHGERTTQFIKTRAAMALAKAREYGGNQAAATDNAQL